jgi:transaldolase
MTTHLSSLRVKLYADGASIKDMEALARKRHIAGYTTNPSLVRKLGAKDYEKWCRDAINVAGPKPISIEVLADDFPEMKRQAQKIASWGENVYVKIPITNSKGESALPLVTELTAEGLNLNITALLTTKQVLEAVQASWSTRGVILSVFAGRVADTGVDPQQTMAWLVRGIKAMGAKNVSLLWASCREVYSIIQADKSGCDIITVPPDILGKAEKLLGYDLDKLSLETVQMFEKDARDAGYTL